MVNTRRKHVECFICKKKLCNEKWLDARCQQYHVISMHEGLLPNRILPPAGWDHPEPSWFDYSRCNWMAIDKLSINDLLRDNIQGEPPPEDMPNEEPIDPQQSDLTWTPDPTKTKAHWQIVGVENAGGESVWQSYWIVQRALQVLGTMESMASFSVSTRLSAGSVV